jgi:hypothetical protein
VITTSADPAEAHTRPRTMWTCEVPGDDSEMDAIVVVLRVLAQLTPPGRARVLDYVAARVEVDA